MEILFIIIMEILFIIFKHIYYAFKIIKCFTSNLELKKRGIGFFKSIIYIPHFGLYHL